jgi:hypothetical protein
MKSEFWGNSSWITVDRYQRPHVFFYDNRNYYPTTSGDVYYSWSEDGGVTWQPNEQVNDASPCWTSGSSGMMGDYQQIDTDTNYVYCEWSDHRWGRNSWSYIAAARRPLPPYVGVVEERPVASPWQQSRFVLEQNAPNPVVSGTRIAFQLEQAQRVEVGVYDLAGKRVRSLLSRGLDAGAHSAYWDARDDAGRSVPAGVYYYSLSSGETSATRQLVLMH